MGFCFFVGRIVGVRALSGVSAVVVCAFCFLLSASWQPAQTQSVEADAPKPLYRIDLSSLGYTGLSDSARLSGESNFSLDFVDSDHILVTFNPKKLFTRLPACTASHADRLIHAVIVEIPSGRVVRETEWYLHDSRRYLWKLANGRFLLRKLNYLYAVDSNFNEKLVLDSPKQLLWVSVTPDGKQIITEAAETSVMSQADAKTKRVKISLLDLETLSTVRSVDAKGLVNLEATSSGFAEMVRSGSNIWLVRFGDQHTNIARVKSVRSPKVLYSSANTLLLGRCSPSKDTYNLSAFTVSGRRLWGQRWSGCRYTAAISGSEDGIRFALGSTAIRRSSGGPHGEDAGKNSGDEDFVQTIEVFDTASGTPILSLEASPAVLDEHNFALSPDAMQLALLSGRSVDLYALREPSTEDRTKYLAVKSDTPGLEAPATKVNEGTTEPMYVSSDNDQTSQMEGQKKPEGSTAAVAGNTMAIDTEGGSAAGDSTTANSPGDLGSTPGLTLKAETRLVALDVVVTDSKGQPVRGLPQSDFAVAESGKPQALRHFHEYSSHEPGRLASPSVPLPASSPPKLPANVFSNMSQPGEPEFGAVTVVLLDLLNTPLSDQAFAQAELIKFLKSKPKGSQFALCILGNRLQMIQGFTQDNNVLLAAAGGKKGSVRYRPLIQSESIGQPTLEAATATAQVLPELEFFVASFRQQQSELRVMDADRRMFATVDAFAHIARYLSGIPGRKNLVWLSGSFQLGIYPNLTNGSLSDQTRNYSDNLKRVANLLEEAHVAVYPVDVKGLATDPLFSATSNDNLAPISMQGSTPTGPSQGGTVSMAGGRRTVNSAVSIATMQNQNEEFGLSQMGERSTMNQIAADTGGQAFYNNNDITKAIQTAAEQGSNYYALSYTPADKNYDGGFRKIKVTLPGKKFRLAYRGGYYAVNPSYPVKSPKDLMSSLAVAAMQQGSPQSRQIVFGARIVPVGKPYFAASRSEIKSSKKRKAENGPPEMQRYSIDYAVAPGDLRFIALPNGNQQDIINFMITVFDEDGHLVASQNSQTVMNLEPEGFRDIILGGLRLHQEIDVPKNSAAMRLGVEEVANSHIGTMEIPLPVPAPPDMPIAERRTLPPIEPD